MTISQLLKQYKLRFGFTIGLVLLETTIALLFPLFIGLAIDDAIKGSHTGAIHLGLLGVSALVVGVGRRVFDSRFYAIIYREKGAEILDRIEENTPSVKTARLGMIREFVEFMENEMPELIHNSIGLIGVVTIIATLNLNVFFACLIVTFIITIIYLATSKRTIRFNKNYNDEIEKQVDEVSKNNASDLKVHLKNLMKWNIKLSDLEAMNFSFSWIALIAFLILSILLPIEDGLTQYGALFALVMYAFQYTENVISLPFYYQSWLRLKEISKRLK